MRMCNQCTSSQVFISEGARIPLRPARKKLWAVNVPAAGGTLLRHQAGATHILLGDEPFNRICKKLESQAGVAPALVHYNWLSQTLRLGCRQNEDDYAPPALLAHRESAGSTPVPSLSVHEGGPPSTVLLLCLPGIGWAQRDAVLEALQPSTPLSVMQLHSGARLEVPSQTLANLVTVARPKRGREGEDGQVSAPGPRPLEFYAATARQMAAAGYPGCEESGATHVPEGYASTADFPSELVWWIRAWAGAFSTHPCPPPITSSPSIAPPPLPPPLSELPGQASLVAVDCEMCITARGLELTRVTLLHGDDERVLLDELVVPDVPILDYNTQYSGITAEMLEGVTTRVADVWRALRPHLGPQTWLVGHTLENDLRALRLVHARCLDTALLFPRPRGPAHRPSLRHLASQHLRAAIQAGAHDSREDAAAALRLLRLKTDAGPTLGVLARAGPAHAHLLDHFVFASLSDVAERQEREARALDFSDREGCATACAAAAAGGVEPLVQETARRVAAVVRALPPQTLCLLLSGAGNTVLCRTLYGDSLRARKDCQGAGLTAQRAAAAADPAIERLAATASRGFCALLTTPNAE
ncbi:Small RNA degrading nuclease 5 [Auxenochlorella protothecoides]|uniref:Small RNA degrading nuclease 5 n=1 Tax=Auxenochlorella protothecoides TaxID=3075 RepID=A0A087SDG2_AUXPR|nr:Small RNA degrading nuclease 5 [Auxenochlorella protothecoides]KFM23766.1 Small RNA degrading nuclease 5 [Auxenochlorella protothecoides]